MGRSISKQIITFIVSLALFMDALDTTIINTAIPAMAHSLNVHPVDLKLALISYLLSLAIFIPISGWIADKYGSKRVFIFALIVFTLSSFSCGTANNLTELVIIRSIQGIGGSLMLPLGRLIIMRTFARHEYVDAMNSVIMVVSLGLMLGPLAGGIITEHLSWQWIFWVNIPVGLFVLFMSMHWLINDEPKKVRSFDWLGFMLFGGGIALLVYSLSDFSESTSTVKSAFYIFCFAILLLIGYFLHSNKQHHPIINVELFRIRTFWVSITSNIISRIGFGGMPFLLPLLFQIPLGYSPQTSGLLITPIAIAIIITRSKFIFTRIIRLLGYKRLLLINTMLLGLSLWSFTLTNENTPIYGIVLLTFFFGVVITMQYSAMNSLAYADVTPDDLSATVSILSVTQQLSQSFGVAMAALLLRLYSLNSTETFLLSPSIFHHVFTTMGIITLLSSLIFLNLKKNDGQQILTAPAQEKISSH